MKIRSSRAVTSATEFGSSMKGMIEQFFDRAGHSQYLVNVAAVSDLDMVQINLAIEGYGCWIAVYKKSARACEMKCSGPTFTPTTKVSKVMEWARIMNIFANIVDNIRRVIVPQMKMDVVESATITAATDVHYRVYECSFVDGYWEEDDCINAFNLQDDAIKYARDNANEHTGMEVVQVIGRDAEVIWTSWNDQVTSAELGTDEHPFVITAATDVTTQDLGDLMRAAWESANAEWGNSAEDLLEWEDAFYTDESYRNGVAEYVIENIPQLKEVKMNQINVVADEDEDTSELTFVIEIDGQPVDKVRTWYVGGRWDAFMDEL